MSYTKGPYKRHFWVVFDNDGDKLADFDVSAEHAQLDPQTVIDNANLFVAGPELVEALEMLLNETNAGLWDCLPVEKAKQALTKAKGGQP